MPTLDSCISNIYEPGNIPADSGLPPTAPVSTSTSEARFNGGSSMSVNAVGDPHFANVVLLISFNGTDGATAAMDDSLSGHALTFNGNAQLDTGRFKFGTASLLLDGVNDYVQAADHADWTMSGPFTIELFFQFDTLPGGTQVPICHWNNAPQQAWIATLIPDATNQYADFTISTDGTALSHVASVADANYAADTWVHYAADRDSSNKLRLYLDGVMVASKVAASGMHNSTAIMTIGATALAGLDFAGWIDEVRITKGVSRYGDVNGDSSFTPPIAAFPRS